MECVRISFAPGAEAFAARSTLERVVGRLNRSERWGTLRLDFFAFAEIPAGGAEEAAQAGIPEETGLPETAEAGLPEASADTQSLAAAESPFFCVLLCAEAARELLAAVSEGAGRGGVRIRFAPLSPGEAEALYREALGVCRAAPGGTTPELAAACGHLARLLSDAGRTEEAETLYREALDGFRDLSARRGGAEAPLAEASRDLARFLYGAGRLRESEKLYCDAMDIYRELSKRNGAYHAPLARTCRDLAMCLEDAGRPEAAEWFYRNALDGYRKLSERNPAAYAPKVAAVCGNLAGLVKSAGRVAEAAALYRIALETYAKLARDDPPQWEPRLAFLYENLAAFERERSPSAGNALLQSAWLLYQKYPDLAPEAERVRAQLRES